MSRDRRRHIVRRNPLSILSLALISSVVAGCFLLPVPDRHGIEALEGGGTLTGAWLGEWPTDSRRVIAAFEGQVGARLDFVDVYLDWYTPFHNVSHTVSHILARGSLPVLTWEAQGVTTRDILEGTMRLPLRDGRTLTLDAYLDDFAAGACRTAKAGRQPVFIRVLHEMNGHWFAWGIAYEDEDGSRPNTDDSYRAAWRKIHGEFTGRCGDSVRFIWAVNHFSVGEGTSFTGPYPGDAYVDFVGIDGYNWGTNAEWGWQSFDTLFLQPYCALVEGTGRPILLAEVSSTEKGGEKAAWIRDMFQRVESYPRVVGFVWFNDAKHEVEIGGQMDWPMDSSSASLAAFQEGMQRIGAARAGEATPLLPGPPPRC